MVIQASRGSRTTPGRKPPSQVIEHARPRAGWPYRDGQETIPMALVSIPKSIALWSPTLELAALWAVAVFVILIPLLWLSQVTLVWGCFGDETRSCCCSEKS